MSKQWGHGYHKGQVDTVENMMPKWLESGKDIEACKQEWTKETLRRHLIKRDRHYFCLCPFHTEKTPSCMYEPFDDEFYCFGCGEKGNGFELAQQLIKTEDNTTPELK